ncbi:RNA 3'-terminal phosphate cyclase domain-containing protein [Glomus cerebriforme]|uniref:RNA 3'-terminal-phosphate cyclase (ATP) n=1 Tax=Glomus cerebriforme TaxID=658196 RepID=A0A397SCD1_9GLOM|nr:RNA 3'-terminal phosphate cyclase domain-containing protein [Glomus cerebriforme]
MSSAKEVQTKGLILDASLLEGGGQGNYIVSCLLNKPIKLLNVRAKREAPGLKPQHACGIKLMQNIFQADLQGDNIGSQEIYFKPNKVNTSSTFIADTQTAGSITLLIQISLPALLFSTLPPKTNLFIPPRSKKVILKGGTTVISSPPIDFIIEVFKPIVEREFGLNFNVSIIGRGYYPQGKGEVILQVDPIVERALKPLNLVERGTIVKVKGRVTICNTSKQIGKQMVACASKVLTEASLPELEGIQFDIETNIERINAGKGSEILLWAETNTGCIISGNATINKRESPEEVGRNAAEALIRNLKHGGCVDEHLQDQLIIFMALAEGRSKLVTGPVTLHTRTAIYFVEVMSGAKFHVKKFNSSESLLVNMQDEREFNSPDLNGSLYLIECEGIGLKISKEG